VSRSLAIFVAGEKEKVPEVQNSIREQLLNLVLKKLEIEDKQLVEEIKNYKVEEL
jgi:hypothetical protein